MTLPQSQNRQEFQLKDGKMTSFDEWWIAFMKAADETMGRPHPYDNSMKHEFKEYFDDGDSPEEALAMEISYMTHDA